MTAFASGAAISKAQVRSAMRSPREPGRPGDDHGDEDDKGEGILPFAREIGGAEGLEKADDEATDHGAGNVADAAQDRRSEGLEARDIAHAEIDRAVVEPDQHAGDRRQGRADDEGQQDDAVDIDADEPRRVLVERGRAHRLAEPGVLHEEVEPQHHRDADDEEHDLDAAQDRPPKAQMPGRQDRRIDLEFLALDQHGADLEDEGNAERRDQRDQRMSAHYPEAPIDQRIHRIAETAAEDSRPDEGHQDAGPTPIAASLPPSAISRVRADIGAVHEDGAMGKVDEADDPVDHGVAQRDDGVDRADGQAVDDLLEK